MKAEQANSQRPRARRRLTAGTRHTHRCATPRPPLLRDTPHPSLRNTPHPLIAVIVTLTTPYSSNRDKLPLCLFDSTLPHSPSGL